MVNDAEAVYPVRIDPTFSDDNWVRLGGIPGANGDVLAAVVEGSGNLYFGGYFTIVGTTTATNIAKWNGSSWSALGSGIALNDYLRFKRIRSCFPLCSSSKSSSALTRQRNQNLSWPPPKQHRSLVHSDRRCVPTRGGRSR